MLKIKKFLHRNIYPIFFYFLPIKNKKVVFSSYAGKQYSDNPRAISEKLHEMYPEVDIVWLMNDSEKTKYKLPYYIRVIENESLSAAYELYTAKVWVDNCRKPLFFKKRKGQKYIQTWHGTPLKLIEADAGDKLGKRYRRYAKRDTKNMDLLISGNEHSTSIFKRAFEYKGEILESGTPRNDLLLRLSQEISLKVREKLGYTNEKLILYAPTFRNDFNKNGISQLEQLNPIEVLNSFEEKFDKKCILLLRFHPNVANKIDKDSILSKYEGRVLDVSMNWDMQELLCASDVLITDYSSVFFDYSILCRPIFIFTPDKNDYCNERGLYFDIKELPICSAESSSQLINQILAEDEDKLKYRTVSLLEQIGNKESGNASLKIIEIIMKYIKTKN